MQTSAHVLIPSPFKARARVTHFDTDEFGVLIPSPIRGRARVGVERKVKPNNRPHNNHSTPIPAFPLTWGRSFDDSALLIPSPFRDRAKLTHIDTDEFGVLIPSPFRGRARVGVKSKVEPNNCAYCNHFTPIPTFPLAWGRSFNDSALLIPSPFRGRAGACPVLDTGVGVKRKVKPNNCPHNNHLTPIPAFPLAWGRSFNHAE